MKLLFINQIHHKNLNAVRSYKNINITEIPSVDYINNINLSEYDFVYSPSEPIDIKKYPKTKFIFGPHFSVIPDNKIDIIKENNSIYIEPCEWAKNFWVNYDICNGLNIKSLPFGVDTTKFNEIIPIKDRQKVFIYYKGRSPSDLETMICYLKSRNIDYHIFSYIGRYNEDDYINYLKESKYGIWVGAHESQGFALEEALSCNVPLFVWDVISMNQEYGYNYSDIPATVIPYWDERCGEYFYNESEINQKFNLFISKLDNYKPRDYILENLSMEICEQKLINLVNEIKI
jgi:hypothetical protein